MKRMNYQGYRPPQPPQGPFPPQMPPSQPPQNIRYRRKKKGGKGGIFALLLVLLIAAGGSVFAWQVNAQNEAQEQLIAEVTAYDGLFLPNVYVDDIHLGGMTAEQGLAAVNNRMNSRQNSWSLSLTYKGHTFITLNYATLGITSDPQEAYNLVKQAYMLGKAGSIKERKQVMDETAQTPYKLYTTRTALSEKQLDQILSQIQPHFISAPTDAYLAYFSPDSKDPFVIQKEMNGSTLDVGALKAQILERLNAGKSGALEIVPQVLYPTVTEKDVRMQVSLLHEAVTPIASSSTVERTSNIRMAFSKINGMTLEPGKKFSFNQVVGARTYENGFKYAIEYVAGMEEIGVGGGVCQASTTVYLAALQSGLEITDRTAHSDPVSYTEFGQDATVYLTRDRKIDFVFKNSTANKIYITAKVEEVKKNQLQCVVRIYGESLGNVSYKLRTQTVEMLPAPLTVSYQDDKDHTYVTYRDEEPYLLKKAREGYINETYLQRFVDGMLVEETLISRDTCKPREAVYLRGTKNR